MPATNIPYVMQAAPARCPTCGKPVRLLAPHDLRDVGPLFYVCWTCREVRQAGVGLCPDVTDCEK
jgi:hypothetical protein